jgi:uncharacterized protein
MLGDTRNVICRDEWRMSCLRAAAALKLPDWYIAAGFVRSAIWDVLHEKPAPTPLNDVDVVYHDAADLDPAREARLEAALRARLPGVKWEVRNQARMHLRNHHPPYRDAEHAIAHWIETPTCVGVRLEPDGALTVVAPYGLEANWSLRVSPNPVVPYPAAVFNERVRGKRWPEIWPKLRIEWPREPDSPT